jgi:protein-disulfide isomerase
MKKFALFIILITQLTASAQKTTPAAPTPGPARVEIVVFSDFQCPFCAHFATAVRELQSKGIEGVPTTVRFKHFPLGIHPAAPLAHQASLAAAEQGKFWEMHDLLFAHQSALDRKHLLTYAKSLRLNLIRFQRDLDSQRIKQTIEADKLEGQRLGIAGTPAFFINENSHSGTRSFDQLKGLVVAEQRRVQALAEITEGLMSKGPANAPVTLEFFADLQSPITRSAMNQLDLVLQKYPSTVRLQFRNFPLPFHPQAVLAHEAAMIAARQECFWEFASYIMDHQDSLREQNLISYASQIGLDQVKFAEMLRQRRYLARIDADVLAGLKRGIRGSPVVFVNGKRIDGVPSMQMLTEYVEAELVAQTKKRP